MARSANQWLDYWLGLTRVACLRCLGTRSGGVQTEIAVFVEERTSAKGHGTWGGSVRRLFSVPRMTKLGHIRSSSILRSTNPMA